MTIAGRQTDELVSALVERRLATANLSPVEAAEEWEGEARLREILARIAELMAAFNGGVLSVAIVSPRCNRWRPSRQLQAERRDAGDLRRARPTGTGAMAAALVEAVVVSQAERKGSPWKPYRLEVVWRS